MNLDNLELIFSKYKLNMTLLPNMLRVMDQVLHVTNIDPTFISINRNNRNNFCGASAVYSQLQCDTWTIIRNPPGLRDESFKHLKY